MGDTIIIDEPEPKKPDVVVVAPEAAKTEKKTVTEKTVTVTESRDD